MLRRMPTDVRGDVIAVPVLRLVRAGVFRYISRVSDADEE